MEDAIGVLESNHTGSGEVTMGVGSARSASGGNATWGFALPESAPRPLSGRAGQSLVELSLLLPVIMFILLGTADLGRAFNAHITITGAAYKGAIYGSASPTNAADSTGIRTAALADTTTLTGTPPTVTSATGTDPYGYQTVTVTVSYSFQALFPYPGLPSSIPLQRSAKMRVKP